ncbi:Gsl4096 protein [Candidatus Vecturithrix granuli]|uniref:Gsl4096 protein n=1 Tax=Vecturithrix granuli TaxID=1499967 RepID=A0A081C6T4_VECG1|nr:Gsl4096 protein [Candidatus Vecturithrix granuli]
MLTAQITLNDNESQVIQDITEHTGKSLEDILHEAVHQFISRMTAQNRLFLLRQARGLWKDRDDLPDFQTLRHGWDRFEGNREMSHV